MLVVTVSDEKDVLHLAVLQVHRLPSDSACLFEH